MRLGLDTINSFTLMPSSHFPVYALQADLMAKMKAQQAAFLAMHQDFDDSDEDMEGKDEGSSGRMGDAACEGGGQGAATPMGREAAEPGEKAIEGGAGGGEGGSWPDRVPTLPMLKTKGAPPSASGSDGVKMEGGGALTPRGAGPRPSLSPRQQTPSAAAAAAAFRDGSWEVTLGRISVCDGECVVCRERGGAGEGLDEWGAGGSGSSRGGVAAGAAAGGGGGARASLGPLGWVAHVSVCSTMAAVEVSGVWAIGCAAHGS